MLGAFMKRRIGRNIIARLLKENFRSDKREDIG